MDLIELEKVEILLDSEKINNKGGQIVSGSVKIKLNGNLKVSIVKIVLRSMAEVNWVENAATIHYRDGYKYHDIVQLLNVVYEIPDNIRKTKLTKGEHSVPFVFILPDNIPSSFDTAYGHIHYWIEVIIDDELFAHEVYRDRKNFTVESPIRNHLYLSVGGGTEKEFGLLSLGSGKVRIDASLRKKGHTPGETVEVHCLVTNTSTVGVTPRASFFQTQIFMAKERHKTLEYAVHPVVGEPVNSGETGEQIIKVKIPKDIPLSMKTRLISIKYFIHVTLDIPHALDIHLNLPIIITNQSALDDL